MNNMVVSSLRWMAYPLTLIFGVFFYASLTHVGISIAIASFIAVIVCGACIVTALEIFLPYRKEWTPQPDEIKIDLMFMMLVQVGLPKILTIYCTLGLIHLVDMNELYLASTWPQHWPLWLQVLLMMLAADFFRYWLHRAMHTWVPLWSFHAVHHSVTKLYWLNVGRFHPIDKCLQFLFDVIPFIVLGVSQDVVMLYFVIYAINGFFQHSNIDVRLGWLNYIVSGPELHRWHHSKTVKQSNNNYGNNFIVWDLIFGTYFLPCDQAVKTLGVLNPDYPTGFLGQLKAPFIRGMDKPQ